MKAEETVREVLRGHRDGTAGRPQTGNPFVSRIYASAWKVGIAARETAAENAKQEKAKKAAEHATTGK